MIYYYVKQAPKPASKDEVKIEILDATGNAVRKYSSSKSEPLDEPLDPDDKKPEKQIKSEDGLNRALRDFNLATRRDPGFALAHAQAADTYSWLGFFGVLGGLLAFGPIGLFLGPITMALLLTLWRDWTRAETTASGTT